MSKAKFEIFLDDRRIRINRLLTRYLSEIKFEDSKKFNEAMRYVTRKGKRMRPLLVYVVGMAYGVNPGVLDAPACALEMIHAFSLVHDDLPAMDNDVLRRGEPTCHIVFDEATAILVGDALAIGAFQILNEAPALSSEKKVMMSKILAKASGTAGMIGGQYLDLHLSRNKINQRSLEQMYLLKTGALIHAAVKLGAIAAGVNSKKELWLLEKFAQNVGFAFQITDDLLNIESSPAKLGKNVGTDSACNKITYPVLVGIPEAKAKIKQLWRQSEKIIEQLRAKRDFLLELTSYIMQRDV